MWSTCADAGFTLTVGGHIGLTEESERFDDTFIGCLKLTNLPEKISSYRQIPALPSVTRLNQATMVVKSY